MSYGKRSRSKYTWMNLYCSLIYLFILLLALQAVTAIVAIFSMDLAVGNQGQGDAAAMKIALSAAVAISHFVLIIIVGTVADFLKCIMQIEKNGR